MNTSSDDEFYSTTPDHIALKRHRRHTIARPISALALISDSSASDDDDLSSSGNEKEDDSMKKGDDDDDQLDRLSDILSNLIQEANEAVNYDEKESINSLPLIRKLSSSSGNSDIQQPKRVHKSGSASRQSPTILYPSASYSTIPRKRSSIATTGIATNTSLVSTRTVNSTSSSRKNRIIRDNGDVLLESFERLDSSLALIDSLSRDLVPEEQSTLTTTMTTIASSTANNKKKSNNNGVRLTMKPAFDARLSALLLLPLLHVPHALISMVFDTMSSTQHAYDFSASSSSSTWGGMVVWAFIFAITNLVVDKAVIIKSGNAESIVSSVTNTTTTRVASHRRQESHSKKSLPGAFSMERAKSNPSSSSSNSKRRPGGINSYSSMNNRKLYKRRTFQQQQQLQKQRIQNHYQHQQEASLMQRSSTAFPITLERKPVLLRRNSL